jgi:hypothetical protein
MFQPNWPSSSVHIIMVKDSAAHCSAVFFPPIAVASDYFGYVGYHQYLFGCSWVARGCFSVMCDALR